jgi:hypothetical protein
MTLGWVLTPLVSPPSLAVALHYALFEQQPFVASVSFVTLQALIRLQVKPQQQIYGHLGAARALSAHGESSGKTGNFCDLRFNYPIREVMR